MNRVNAKAKAVSPPAANAVVSSPNTSGTMLNSPVIGNTANPNNVAPSSGSENGAVTDTEGQVFVPAQTFKNQVQAPNGVMTIDPARRSNLSNTGTMIPTTPYASDTNVNQ